MRTREEIVSSLKDPRNDGAVARRSAHAVRQPRFLERYPIEPDREATAPSGSLCSPPSPLAGEGTLKSLLPRNAGEGDHAKQGGGGAAARCSNLNGFAPSSFPRNSGTHRRRCTDHSSRMADARGAGPRDNRATANPVPMAGSGGQGDTAGTAIAAGPPPRILPLGRKRLPKASISAASSVTPGFRSPGAHRGPFIPRSDI